MQNANKQQVIFGNKRCFPPNFKIGDYVVIQQPTPRLSKGPFKIIKVLPFGSYENKRKQTVPVYRIKVCIGEWQEEDLDNKGQLLFVSRELGKMFFFLKIRLAMRCILNKFLYLDIYLYAWSVYLSSQI